MLRLLSDADVHGPVIRGLRERMPTIDLVRAQEVGLRTAADPDILDWAAAEGRIVVTQDRRTMIGYAHERVAKGLPMPGLFVLRRRTPTAQAIDALLLVEQCSEQHEWNNLVEHLPL